MAPNQKRLGAHGPLPLQSLPVSAVQPLAPLPHRGGGEDPSSQVDRRRQARSGAAWYAVSRQSPGVLTRNLSQPRPSHRIAPSTFIWIRIRRIHSRLTPGQAPSTSTSRKSSGCRSSPRHRRARGAEALVAQDRDLDGNRLPQEGRCQAGGFPSACRTGTIPTELSGRSGTGRNPLLHV